MASFRGVLAGRARWLAIFTLLLFVSTVVPVLAESGEPAHGETPLASEAQAGGLPSASDVAKGLEELQEKEAAEETWQKSPEAEQQREASLHAYADVTPGQAEELLLTMFAEQLAAIDQDPARMLSDAGLEKALSPTDARITVDGRTVLLDGTLPVKAPDEEGDLAKVDLDLVASEEGFEPSNPLVELELPASSAEAISVGETGLAIEPVLTAPPSEARPLEGEDVLYPETQTDTDLIAAPLGAGIELFSLLRSVQSPEELRFELTLPAGATLREDGEGGAEVLRDGERLIRIPAPYALDAQGADVPVAMRVEGNRLALAIEHREMDVAYPLLLDPILEYWYGASSWQSGQNLAALDDGVTWIPTSTDWGRFEFKTHSPAPGLVGGAERGLFVLADPTAETQWAYKTAQWNYTVPGTTTYITKAGISPFWRFNFGCGPASYPQPHDYIGLWSPQWSPTHGWMYHQSNAAAGFGHGYAEPPADWRQYTAQVFILGLGTGIYNTAAIPCSRYLYAGGVYVSMDDPEQPTLGEVTGAPTHWVSGTDQFTIVAKASDPGLGIQNITISSETVSIPLDDTPCTGLKANSCPAGVTMQKTFTGKSFDQGIREPKLSANDPTGEISATYKWTMRVDHSEPTVNLDGQLAIVTDEQGGEEPPPAEDEPEPLSLPVYNLEIEAKDGSKDDPSKMRSGVESIEIFLDEKPQTVPWKSQACPEEEGSCEMTEIYQLKLLGLSAGLHTLKVLVTDQVGNKRERHVEFEYFPATGIKDSYAMHYFPLPDGLGNEEEELHPARPELAVNVMNGNLVYREKDVDIEGYSVDLEVERYYNSQLPEVENTEWGDGWTLAQTPELDPKGGPVPSEAEVLDSSGAFDEGVELPTEVGAEEFDPELQATIAKEASGGYELTDETGESATSVAFDEGGQAEALRADGYAKVDFAYEKGDLTEIAVDDPASAASKPDEEPEVDPTPTYSSAFGSYGAGDGQFNKPADVAFDPAGNLWVLDRTNSRIQKFDPAGKFLTKFGLKGSADGQLSSPSALAIDAQGNIWVADSGNRRVQKFDPSGKFLLKFGSQGTGNGQFSGWGPRGIAIDAQGNLWVSDYSARVQKFNPKGEFLLAAGSFGESAGLDVGGGKVWVGDWTQNRVNVFSEAGALLFKVGAYGTGEGQFNHPDTVEIDAEGNVWVGDQSNHRIQRLDSEGKYVAKFGSSGAGAGQFNFAYPMGVETDGDGAIWVADVNNNRVQRWQLSEQEPPEDNDPRVDVGLEGGLVSSVEGEEAGAHSYEHEGDLLTSHEGPEGETVYDYDGAGRLTFVELANETKATIAYHADGRVKSITVDPAGSEEAKTTWFSYSDEPRRTTVEPPNAPNITYDIGADGSVLKWWNAVKPPTITPSGTLDEYRGKLVWVGDHNLIVHGYSEEGIASIDIIANGSVLVDEKDCKQDPEKEGTECIDLDNEWITYTGNHAPGILNLEVVVTDNDGNVASERFWVEIPYTPPPPPGVPEEPLFAEVLEFREERGLDLDLDPVEDELELNDRVLGTIGEWKNPQTPEGRVARASWKRWGVPLRTAEVAELEYRIAYQEQGALEIPTWAKANASSTYAGYYIDERAGGLIRVGFKGDATGAMVKALKDGISLEAKDRIAGFIAAPGHSLNQLETLEQQVLAFAEANPGLSVRGVVIDIPQNSILVRTGDVQQTESAIKNTFGEVAPISVIYGTARVGPRAGRERDEGRVLAGDRFTQDFSPEGSYCTAGFGAWERGRNPETGKTVDRHFLLAAGHCAQLGIYIRRRGFPGDKTTQPLGATARRGFDKEQSKFPVDISAVRLDSPGLVPRGIYLSSGAAIPVKGIATPRVGMIVCSSGVTSDEEVCGMITHLPTRSDYSNKRFLQVTYDALTLRGDSGSPVWQHGTNNAVGLLTSGQDNEETGIEEPPSYFTPLVADPARPMPDIFGNPDLSPLHLFTSE